MACNSLLRRKQNFDDFLDAHFYATPDQASFPEDPKKEHLGIIEAHFLQTGCPTNSIKKNLHINHCFLGKNLLTVITGNINRNRTNNANQREATTLL